MYSDQKDSPDKHDRKNVVIASTVLLGLVVELGLFMHLYFSEQITCLMYAGNLSIKILYIVSIVSILLMLFLIIIAVSFFLSPPRAGEPQNNFELFYVPTSYVIAIVLVVMHFAAIFYTFGIVESVTGVMSCDKLDALYFSIVTLTTLGYGDFRPSPESRPFAAMEAITGYIMLAFFISILSRLFGRIRPSAVSSEEKE